MSNFHRISAMPAIKRRVREEERRSYRCQGRVNASVRPRERYRFDFIHRSRRSLTTTGVDATLRKTHLRLRFASRGHQHCAKARRARRRVTEFDTARTCPLRGACSAKCVCPHCARVVSPKEISDRDSAELNITKRAP